MLYYIVYKKSYLSPNSGKQWEVGDIRLMQEERNADFDSIVHRFEHFWEIDFEAEGVRTVALGEEIAVKISNVGTDFYNKKGERIMWLNKIGIDSLCGACAHQYATNTPTAIT